MVEPIICMECGKPFVPKYPRRDVVRRFCSSACAGTHYGKQKIGIKLWHQKYDQKKEKNFNWKGGIKMSSGGEVTGFLPTLKGWVSALTIL
jgi:hypothetical protein